MAQQAVAPSSASRLELAAAKDAPHSSSTRYVLNIQPVVPIEIAEGGT